MAHRQDDEADMPENAVESMLQPLRTAQQLLQSPNGFEHVFTHRLAENIVVIAGRHAQPMRNAPSWLVFDDES